MSTVSGLTSSNVAASTTSTTRARGTAGPDGDDSAPHGHRGQPPGGGNLARQLTAALQSLGLDVPASGKADKTDGSAPAAEDGSQASTLRQDLHEFMHQLFAATREGGNGGGNGIGYGKGGRPGFGQGLAALISDVSGGNAPAGLQSAFDKLTADLGAGSSSAGSATSSDTSGTSTSGDTGTSTAVTLQALLTKLQGNLGYVATTAASSTVSAAGSVVNAVA